MTQQGSLLWRPSEERVLSTAMAQFLRWLADQLHRPDLTLAALHTWSTEQPGQFWSHVWRFCHVIGEPGDPDRTFQPGADMRTARILADARLSLAENLLRRSGTDRAIVFAREDGVRRVLSWDELRTQVAAAAAALRDLGVTEGDRVAAWMPNTPETVIAMLATNAIGAVFTSTSPDFGVSGVLDRFGQVEPTVLVAADGYVYGGKRHDRLDRLGEVVAGLPTLKAR